MAGRGELFILCGLFLALGVGAEGFALVGLKPDLGALVVGVLIAGHPRASELSKALFGFKELMLVGFFLSIGMTGLPTWKCWPHPAALSAPSRQDRHLSLHRQSVRPAGQDQPFRLVVPDQLFRIRADRGGHRRGPGAAFPGLAADHGHDREHQLRHLRPAEHPFRVRLPPNVHLAVSI
jgi:hypothetical protein